MIIEKKIPRVVMALPCYNEAKNLPDLLKNFELLNNSHAESFLTEVLIIDDCSTDNTQEVLSPWRDKQWIQIITHQSNKGLTGGINTSFNEFSKSLKQVNPPVAYALMDGDNSHTPTHIPSMLEKIKNGDDIVVASRYQIGSKTIGVSWIRQILSCGLAMLFKLFRNIPGVRDYSCGYRMYSPQIVKTLKARFPNEVVLEPSFASMVEILVKCHLLGAKCSEVPMLLRYDLKLGESKMPFKQTIIGNFKLLRTLKRV